MNTDNWPETANRSDWAVLLRIPVHRLYRHERQGKLVTHRKGFNVMITKQEVIRWMRAYNRKLEEAKFQEA
jgi:hypothetical protein